jgi:hypothetical protein
VTLQPAHPVLAQDAALAVRALPVAAYVAEWPARFADLAARAEWPNPFLSPAVVGAVAPAARAEDILVLVAETVTAEGAALPVGLWVLRRRRDLWSGFVPVLETPLDPLFHPSSEPVIAPGFERAALAAFMGWIADSPTWPRVVRAPAWPCDLSAHLPAGVRIAHAERWARAITRPARPVTGEAYLRASLGRHYRKRVAERRALGGEGPLDHVVCRGGEAIAAFEAFVALEAAGWKGRQGTALQQQPAKLREMRAMVAALAAQDLVAVDQLWRADRLVATGLVCEAGRHALYLKTAYDEAHERHSPGRVLAMAMLERRLAGDPLATLDSGMMEYTDADLQIWSERRDHARAHLLPAARREGIWAATGLDRALPVSGWRLRQMLRRAQRLARGRIARARAAWRAR